VLCIKEIHSHHTNIIAFDVRSDQGMEYEFGNLAPNQEARKILVVGIRFKNLKRCRRLAERFTRQPPLLQAHRHVISPSHSPRGNAVTDKSKGFTGNLRIRQIPII